MTKRLFSERDAQWLEAAIQAADSWKGSLYPDDFDQHDANIRAMREALERATKTRRAYDEIRKAYNKLVSQT